MRIQRTVVGLAALLLAAGCGGTSHSQSRQTPPTSSASPSPTAEARPAWAKKYTDEQYADFQAAVKRYKEYFYKHTGPWLDPDPRAAIPIVREYFAPAEGAYQLKLLRWAHSNRFRADRNGRIVWLKMANYGRTQQGNPQVTLHQCTDYVAVHSYERDRELPRTWKTPVIYVVTMGQTPDGTWKIARTVDPGIDKVKAIPCRK